MNPATSNIEHRTPNIQWCLDWARTGCWMFSLALLMMCPGLARAAGTWIPVTNQAPSQIQLMILLTDGTVMCQDGTTNCYRLTPDQYGHYAGGVWSSNIAPMNYARNLCAADVVPDGRVFVAGGEYGPGITNAEIYDPVANAWTLVNPPLSLFNPKADVFSDMISMVTTNGSVLMAPVNPLNSGGTLLYNPASGVWSNGPKLVNVYDQDECGWAMLPDGSIITINGCSEASQRYISALNKWVPDGKVPVNIWNERPQSGVNGCEIGPALTLPNGEIFYAAGTSSNVLYKPSPLGGTNDGTWTLGPITPDNLESADTSGALMMNGKLLFLAATNCINGGCAAPWHFFEYDYTVGATGSLTEVSAPATGFSSGFFIPFMVELPDGTILLSGDSAQLYVYKPDGSPLAAGKPEIFDITENGDGSYTILGTGLNGITEGANEGDDGQMASDYPLVRLVNSSGQVFYARTYNWSSTSIQTGSALETVQFTLPPDLAYGNYSLFVVANGIASDEFTFYGPVWVDFNYGGFFQFGTYDFPYKTLAEGITAVATNEVINIEAGESTETFTNISKPMQLRAVGGEVTIGVGH